METRFTPSGVRLRRRSERPGLLNWLFLPGGPGIGSESLHELVDAIEVPGTAWMVDLPGDGSNVDAPGVAEDPFRAWPQVLIEATDILPNCVYVGHSTGGMYLLATPQLEERLVGLALVSTAPDAAWKPHFTAMTERRPLAEVDAATAAYAADPGDDTLAAIAVASAPWNFPEGSVETGRELLARMPYNRAAVEWSDRNFDDIYVSQWWPETLPTLIVAGAKDAIVWQGGWDDPRFQGPNVLRRAIPCGGHFPWIDNPAAMRDAFADLASRIACAAG